jgi:DoxX-like family
MKILTIIMTLLMALLSIAAGVAKVMLIPEETAFLSQFGFSQPHVVIFGAVQVLGGLLFAVPLSRDVGGIVVTVGFLFSAVLVFMSGNVVFGLASVLPVVLTGALVYRAMRRVAPEPAEGGA